MKTAREVALEVIDKVHRSQSYANLLLPKVLTKEKLSVQDTALVTELVYGTLRAQGTLDWILAKFSTQPVNKIPGKALDILRLGIYQLFYLEKVPSHAAVNESVELAKKSTHAGMVKFVNAVLREISRKRAEVRPPDLQEDSVAYLSVVNSHPVWLVKKWIDELGFEETQALTKADNLRPKLCIRANTLKISPGNLIVDLRKKGIQADASFFVPEAVVVQSPGDITGWPEFNEGLFTVQGEASMLVSYVVNAKRGETILDLCAAPGGKATHLAQMMRNEGKIIAIDINAKRLALINKAAKRLGIGIIETVQADVTELSSEMVPQADKVLVDAPCSGLGVLAKRPDARWRKKPEQIKELVMLQRKLLDSAAKFVRSGGALIYSTCTISKDENQDVVESFLTKHREFEIEDVSVYLPGRIKPKESWAQFYPHRNGLDGIFVARMIKS